MTTRSMYGSWRPPASTRWKYGLRTATKRSAGGLVVFIQGCSVGSRGLSNWYMLSRRLWTCDHLRLAVPFSSASRTFAEYFLWNFFR